MKEKIEKILCHVAEEVLGKLAFIFSFPEEERNAINRASAIAAGVSFEGPFNGTLIMFISDFMLPELAGNMLGVDNEDTTREQQYDALKELINVICGNLLPGIAGKRAIFNVTPPRIIGKDDALGPNDEAELIATVRLSLEEGDCDLCLFIRGPVPAEALISADDEAFGENNR